MQHDPIEAGVGASQVSRPKPATSTDEIAGEKNRPPGLAPPPDADAPPHGIHGANGRPWRDPSQWRDSLAWPYQYRQIDCAVLTFLAILRNQQNDSGHATVVGAAIALKKEKRSSCRVTLGRTRLAVNQETPNANGDTCNYTPRPRQQ